MLSTNVRNFVEGGGNLPAPIVHVTASKILDLSDVQTLQQVNSASAITITVPTNASVPFPVGTEIEIVRWNTGTLTISPEPGVTLAAISASGSITERYGVAVLKKMDANIWLLSGALA